ncbi:---NA---, partial [Paramuricea clavata]
MTNVYSNKFIYAKDYERTLPKPAAPRLVEAGWQTIQLQFNTTEFEEHRNRHYILEVKPQWGPQEKNNLFVVFPYTMKYHYANQTTYTVKDLEPNTGYKFRVIAIKLNKSSPYSSWSNVINTTTTCKKLRCGPTNIRLELRTQKPYQKDEELMSTFHWKPDTTL